VVTRQYTYGLQRISENLSPAVTGNSTWTPSFYGYDSAEGSVRFLSNAAGTVTDAYEYDAFGNQIYRSGTTPNNYMYRAEQYDSDLTLYFLRARYYNPATGRFMSRDPEDGERTDPASLHKYLYAGGDPVNAMDPTGRAELFENVLIVGGSALGPVEEIAVAAWEGMTAWLTYYSGVARMVYLYASDVIRAIDWIKTTGWLAKQLECVLASYLVERYVAEPYLPNLHNGIANGLQKTAVVAAFDRVCIEWR
jgi:RHS repeat-associated protein